MAQDQYVLEVSTEEESTKVLQKYNYKKELEDSLSVVQTYRDLCNTLRGDGYLLSSVDSVKWKKDSVEVKLYIGKQYKWANLIISPKHKSLLRKAGYKEKFYKETTFSYLDYSKMLDQLITYSENHGYPFAWVGLDSIIISDHSVSAKLTYKRGPKIALDSIVLLNEVKVKRSYVEDYLQWKKGDLYNQKLINQVSNRLRGLGYVKLKGKPKTLFIKNKAYLYIPLEDRKSSRIDGIVGFLPNESNNENLLVTGEASLDLKNLFRSGKRFFLHWQKQKQESQLLDVKYVHTRLFGSPLDVDIAFHLLKEDSTFLNVERGVGVEYQLLGNGKVFFRYDFNTSRILAASQFAEDELPPFLDTDYANYSLGYEWQRLDDILYPMKGFEFGTQVSVGNKKILKNDFFNEAVYDNVNVKTTQLECELYINKYFKTGKKTSLFTSLKAGYIFNENIFLNEMFRIGGLQTLRGFNENLFFASEYGLSTIEWRIFTEETSYFLVFVDQAYLKYDTEQTDFQEYPTGFGAGITFDTGGGTFTFIYSLGRSDSQPLALNLSKIHFGFISNF